MLVSSLPENRSGLDRCALSAWLYSTMLLLLNLLGIAGVCGVRGEMRSPGLLAMLVDVPATIGGTFAS